MAGQGSRCHGPPAGLQTESRKPTPRPILSTHRDGSIEDTWLGAGNGGILAYRLKSVNVYYLAQLLYNRALRSRRPAGFGGSIVRWRIAILISAAIAISYLDRQTLPVAIKVIAQDIPLTNGQFALLQSLFLFSYAFMYAGGGKLADRLGTRRGFTVIMVFWSLSCASHAIATSFIMLAASRFLLGIGEGGGFPAATRAVAEWFPINERATAMGIINAGTAVGALTAPPLIAGILLFANWRWIFFLTGSIGVLWVIWWKVSYFPPEQHPRLSAAEHQKMQSLTLEV